MAMVVGALVGIGLLIPWLRGSVIVAVVLSVAYLAIGGMLAMETHPKSFLAVVCLLWAPAIIWHVMLRRRPRPMFRPRRLMVGLAAD